MPSPTNEITAIYLVNTILKKINALPGQPEDSATSAGASYLKLDEQCSQPSSPSVFGGDGTDYGS